MQYGQGTLAEFKVKSHDGGEGLVLPASGQCGPGSVLSGEEGEGRTMVWYNKAEGSNEVGEEEVTKIINLFSIEGRFAINPRVQLVAFYQQNTEFSSTNYNIRFSWEYKPLSFIYLVINRRGFDNLQHIHLTEDHIIAKINFLKQF